MFKKLSGLLLLTVLISCGKSYKVVSENLRGLQDSPIVLEAMSIDSMLPDFISLNRRIFKNKYNLKRTDLKMFVNAANVTCQIAETFKRVSDNIKLTEDSQVISEDSLSNKIIELPICFP